MTKKHIVTYILSALICGTLYPFGREMMIRQEPSGEMVVSTLTLNYALLFVIVGAISPWVTKKLLPRAPKWTSTAVMLVCVSLLLIILTLVGMPMTWETGSK